MNFKKLNKVFKYSLLTFTVLSLFIIVSCDRDVKPVDTSKINVTVVEGTNIVDNTYIIFNTGTTTLTTTSTSLSTTLTTNSETTTMTTINKVTDVIPDDTELEDRDTNITDNSDSNDSSPQTIELLSPKKTTIVEKINKTNSATTISSIVTTKITITTTEDVTTTSITTELPQNSIVTEFVKTFSRGTYYCYGRQCTGGSGRSLIDCSVGNSVVKGSIASSYLYHNYGYNYNGKRTMVYLEINGYPSMNGYYYLDDCDAGNYNVIDFYYTYSSGCPFRMAGVVTVDCYICKY